MTWKNELDNAKKLFSHGTRKQKIEYIFDYYKWHLIVIISLLLILGNIVYLNITKKECVLNGMFLNTFAETEVILDLQNDFTNQFPINSSTEEIFFDSLFYHSNKMDAVNPTSSYEGTQLLITKIAAGEMDFIVADATVLNKFIYNEYCYSLLELLSEEQMAFYSPYFLYYDNALLEQIDNMDFINENLSDIDFPDPSKPELMEEPIPVMINLSGCDKLQVLYPNSTHNYAMIFTVNGSNLEKSLEFLNYLIE